MVSVGLHEQCSGESDQEYEPLALVVTLSEVAFFEISLHVRDYALSKYTSLGLALAPCPTAA